MPFLCYPVVNFTYGLIFPFFLLSQSLSSVLFSSHWSNWVSSSPFLCHLKSFFSSTKFLICSAWEYHAISNFSRCSSNAIPRVYYIVLTVVFGFGLISRKMRNFSPEPWLHQTTTETHTYGTIPNDMRLRAHQSRIGQCAVLHFFSHVRFHSHTQRHIVFELSCQIPSKIGIPNATNSIVTLKLATMPADVDVFFLVSSSLLLLPLYFIQHKQFNWMLLNITYDPVAEHLTCADTFLNVCH